MVTITDQSGVILAKLSTWIPLDLLNGADEAAKQRTPRGISRTRWITEAIMEKLERDGFERA